MDIAHKQTEKILSQIERRVRKEYRQASKEVEQKLDRYFAAFRRKDEAKRELVKSGELSEQDYKAWRTSQLAVGKRWENMKDQLAQDYTNATVIARNISDGYMPEVYAINHNFATYQVETSAKVNTSYTLYSQQSVERLMRENPDILPQVGRTTQELIDSGVLKKWEMKNIQSTMIQGILQGESINALAKRMAYDVGATNYKDCVKHARTMTTATQNAGRVDGYKRAEKMGIDMEQEWVAVLDGRTRHEHRQLDGQRRPVGEPFEVDGYKLDYPADPKAPYYLIMNCRCTLIGQLKGFERDTKEYRQDPDLDGMSYDEWKKAKAPQKGNATSKTSDHIAVNGKDISSTWKRRADQFDFEIEDVINAQGFDGMPRIVSEKEFNEAVKAANNGNGFIAQRSYSAPDTETLDAYREQLYNGKWYVDCSTGGAQYGQGMYCAADYTGTLSQGITKEMEHYKQLGEKRFVDNISDDDKDKILKLRNELMETDEEKYGDPYKAFVVNNKDIIEERLGLKLGDSYTETMTLDPSAKIITYDDLYKEIDSKFDSYDKDTQKRLMDLDEGSWAALLGYDAINAVGHGESGSYTVILNRTKLIIKGA